MNNMDNKQELIILEQLPIISERLDKLSIEIKEKVDNANKLIVNKDTVKEVKQVRANLTKEFNELESQRKQVKSAIMEKYDEFEAIYKDKVSNLYKDADIQLKEKIDSVENEIKEGTKDEIELFARQYFEFNNIDDIVNFDDIGLNITLTASKKSLQDKVLAFVEKVVNDLKLIELEEYKDEIMVEYKNTKDFTTSKLKVVSRHKQLEEMKQKQKEVQLKIDNEARIVEQVEEIVEEITTPKEIIENDEVITVTFTLTDTKENIIKVREFMKKEGIKYA